MAPPVSPAQPAAAAVLTKAVLRAKDLLGLTQAELAGVVGLSEATLSRLANGRSTLAPNAAEGRLAALFLRVFRSLDTLTGRQPDKSQAWLRAHNHHLDCVPLDRLQSAEGLVRVADYLDAVRGTV